MKEESIWKVLNIDTGDESLFITEREARAHYEYLLIKGHRVLRVEKITVVARVTHEHEFASTPVWELS